jgi:hypothetical protein
MRLPSAAACSTSCLSELSKPWDTYTAIPSFSQLTGWWYGFLTMSPNTTCVSSWGTTVEA